MRIISQNRVYSINYNNYDLVCPDEFAREHGEVSYKIIAERITDGKEIVMASYPTPHKRSMAMAMFYEFGGLFKFPSPDSLMCHSKGWEIGNKVRIDRCWNVTERSELKDYVGEGVVSEIYDGSTYLVRFPRMAEIGDRGNYEMAFGALELCGYADEFAEVPPSWEECFPPQPSRLDWAAIRESEKAED